MLTNFYPIKVDTPEFKLRAFEYSDDSLHQLRAKHNSTHSFFRVGDHVFCSWMEDDDISGGDMVLVREQEAPEVIGGLIRHIFFRTFRREIPKIKPLDFYPLRIVSRRTEHDAIREMLPDELKDVVSYKRLNEMWTRAIRINNKDQFGMAITIKQRWHVTSDLSQLHREGYDFTGSAVVHSESIPGLEDILAPSETSVGRVLEFDNENAKVNTTEGIQEIPLNELFLRRSKREIREYLAFRLGEQTADRIFYKVREMGPLGAKAKKFHDEIQNLANYFSKWQFKTMEGFSFSISNDSYLPDENLKLQMPKFIFDIAPGAASTSVFKGLKEYGPYDSSRFTPKKPHILVICHNTSRAGFSKAMGALRNGIPASKFFKQGMRGLYRLHDIDFTIRETKDYSVKSFIETAKRALSSNSEDFDLAIVQAPELNLEISPTDNLYYRSKAFLMSVGIPVQGIQAARTRLADTPLSYVLGNLALQIYSKMGGVPWVLPSSVDVDREIIVGISHIIQRESEFSGGRQSRVVGLTTFFSSDGTFLMANRCQDVPYEQYFDELLSSLENSIKSLSEDYGWKTGDTVRIVFHIFKPIKETEAKVINELVERFSDYEIRFAFVTITRKHPFVLFDNSSNQQEDEKGYFVPARSSNLILNDLECLVQTLGKKEVRYDKHSFSKPVLIKVHQSSTFRDLHHIAQQIVYFTHLSWRSFGPTHLPATLRYAELIARMLSKLRGVPDWNPQVVNTVLKRKKWFL